MAKSKAAVVAVYIVVAILGIRYHQELLLWLQKPGAPSLLSAVLAAMLVALVPVIPYGVVGAVIGVKFGLVVGALINVAASTLAALIMFVLVRVFFASGAQKLLIRYKNIDRFTGYVDQHPFLAVLFARLIPIIPAQAVNIYAGVSRMSQKVFLLATIIGKIPVMITFTMVGDQFVKDTKSV
ncbi:TVP38/TMEM64 family protein [Cohnella sp. GCM10020058]|uniref:TVP38/TMEM64 family protein n=1 Tax=Cohnella sp. GCM10020058 TaxID=3317330 RepID=UPI0036445232